MGKFKRQNGKNKKKEKPFTRVKDVFNYIEENLVKLSKLPINKIQIEKREIDEGDEYNGENGHEYLVFTEDKSAYLIGRTIIFDDGSDWAQPESYESYHLFDYYQERNIEAIELMNKLEKLLY